MTTQPPIITGPGLYITKGGKYVWLERLEEGMWRAPYSQKYWYQDGNQNTPRYDYGFSEYDNIVAKVMELPK